MSSRPEGNEERGLHDCTHVERKGLGDATALGHPRDAKCVLIASSLPSIAGMWSIPESSRHRSRVA